MRFDTMMPIARPGLLSLLITLSLLFSMDAAFAQKAASSKGKSKERFARWDVKTLERHANLTGDTVYVLNFWATWCKPCVAELPFFSEAFTQYKGKPVKIILVSSDFLDETAKLEAFIVKKKVLPPVALITETDANLWIDKVAPSWGGAIPMTLIYQPVKGKREVLARELTRTELFAAIDAQLK